MYNNEQIIQEQEAPPEPEIQAPYAPVNSKSVLSGRPGRAALTPPPPSASSEFLRSQSPPVSPAEPPGPAPVTPPPASVPAEFLEVQQWQEPLVKGPAGLMADFLNAAGSSPSREFESGIWPAPWWDEEPTEAEPEEPAVEVEETARIRGVPLARGEEFTRVLLPDEGLSDVLPSSGQALILTGRRLIAFRGVEGFRDTHIARVSEISQFSVRTGQRNWGAVLQGLLLMISGGFLYLVVGYWLAGQISGPNVPVLNIDVAPLIALLIILAGLLVLLQNYFTRPAGAVVFRGAGVEVAFPFRSVLDVRQIYEFIDLVQAAAQRNAVAPDGETTKDSPLLEGED